jgi:positive regulator of sigma E activity
MAREIGKVTIIENGWMEVKVPTGRGCTSCLGKSACTFSGPDSAYRNFKIPFQNGIQEGDRVTLEIRESAQNLSALIIFGSPVILFPVSYLLIDKVFQISNSEIWSVVVTAILYVVTLILSNRWFSQSPTFQPRIIGVEKAENRQKVSDTLINSNYSINS